MYKIVIHMGLGKTATTTLQNKLFMDLHERGSINFLGRSNTSFDQDYFFPFEGIYKKLKNPSFDDGIEQLRNDFHGLLDQNKVNLISEESFTVTWPRDHELTWRNLSELTKGCDVEILIALRNPVDFFYSAYVEMHRWHYHAIKGKDTIAGFYEHFCNDSDSNEYDMFFYERLLGKIRTSFDNLNLYLFEEFLTSKNKFSELIIPLLGIEENNSSLIYNLTKENSRTSNNKGKYGEAVTLDQKIASAMGRHLHPSIKNTLKQSRVIVSARDSILRAGRKVSVTRPPLHRYLNAKEKLNLARRLCVDGASFSKQYDIDVESLTQYGYTVNG